MTKALANMPVAKTRVVLTGIKPGARLDAFTGALGTGAGMGQAYEASSGRRRGANWRASPVGPNAALSYALPTLRNRSRDAVRQNPYADSAIRTLEDNAVGTGIKPQFVTPDAGLNKELAALWLDWTDESDADDGGDFYALQALVMRGIVEAGEMFGRFRTRRLTDMATVPLQLQLLEPEFCPVDEIRTDRGRQVVNGIEFNPVGRRTAYWMYRFHPQDWGVIPGLDLTPVAVPASEVMHIRQVRRAGQVRGEPWLTRALITLRDFDQYDDAELVRKKIAAMFTAFVKRSSAEGEFMPGEAQAVDQDGAAEPGVSDVSLEPATVQYLEDGEEMQFAAPAEVGGSYEAFVTQQMRRLATATGVLYEHLSGDWNKINDRTFRAAVNEFRRRIERLQHAVLVYQFCRPVHRRWMDTAVLAGMITPPRGMEARDLLRVKWVPQGWSYIHPVQEVQAAELAVRAGFKSRSQIVSESGYDAEVVEQEIAAENTRADQLELKFDSDGRQGKSGSGAGSGSGATGRNEGAGERPETPDDAEAEDEDMPEDERETEDA